MRLINRKQLRRLIESAINEQEKSYKVKSVVDDKAGTIKRGGKYIDSEETSSHSVQTSSDGEEITDDIYEKEFPKFSISTEFQNVTTPEDLGKQGYENKKKAGGYVITSKESGKVHEYDFDMQTGTKIFTIKKPNGKKRVFKGKRAEKMEEKFRQKLFKTADGRQAYAATQNVRQKTTKNESLSRGSLYRRRYRRY